MKRKLEIGEAKDGLYIFNSDVDTPVSSMSSQLLFSECNQISNSKYHIWHAKLGHVPYSILKLIFIDCNTEFYDCDSCHFAKQSKLPFSDSSTSSHELFELIHTDLWGRYATKTNDNCNQFLTILEDKSRATWVFLLYDKIQVPSLLTDFLAYIHNQFG